MASRCAPLLRSASEGAILVVDDEPDQLRRILPILFLKEGFYCEIVTHSHLALERIGTAHFLGVLLDFHLAAGDPHNGESLAQEMRHMGFEGFLFSFSSEDSDSPSIKKRRVAAGMNGVLGKPFIFDKFKSLIASFFAS